MEGLGEVKPGTGSGRRFVLGKAYAVLEILLGLLQPGVGLTLRKYYLTYVKAKGSELSICSNDFQRQVFRVDAQLELFNQMVDGLNRQAEMTFDSSLSAVNHQSVEQNIERG